MSNAQPPQSAGDQAKAVVTVAVPVHDAFRIFTHEIDLWWRRGRRFRNTAIASGIICLEPRVDGRVFESFTVNEQETVVEIGRIKAWEPPGRLLFDWRASNFAPSESTEVEVLFETVPTGTRVTVIHRGWLHIRSDHPVRHGLTSPEFVRMMGFWWGDLLTSLRLRCDQE